MQIISRKPAFFNRFLFRSLSRRIINLDKIDIGKIFVKPHSQSVKTRAENNDLREVFRQCLAGDFFQTLFADVIMKLNSRNYRIFEQVEKRAK